MPTENRSSNTDTRDLFISRNPLGLGKKELAKDRTGFADPRTHADYLTFLAGYEQALAGSFAQRHENDRAEQHQGEPVGWQFYQDGKWWNGDDRIKDHRKNTEAAGYPVRDVFTHADPGEVERLRAELGEAKGEYDRSANKVAALRAQLAELETLLHEVWPYDLGTPLKRRIKAALSASAEPSAHAWTCQPCKIEQPTDRPCDACGGATELKI
jgi:hypothetical protein